MPKKLHIAMLCAVYDPEYIGGIQTHIAQLSKCLQKQYRCHVDIFGGKKDGFMVRLVWSGQVIWQILQKHRQQPIDIIHAHAYLAGLPAFILGKILQIPVIYIVHGSNNLDINHNNNIYLVHQNSLIARFKYFVEKWLLAQIKYTQEISVAHNFLAYNNVNKHIQVIANGVNIQPKHLHFVRQTIHKPLRLLFVGRLDKFKGIELLFQALVHSKYHFSLTVVGVGPLKSKLLILQQDLSLNINFVGRKMGEDLAKLYRNHDLLVLPSLAEGQPLTILEAWSWKLPVLVTDVGDNPWMIQNAKNGFIAKVGDVQDLAKQLDYIYRHKEILPELGENGFKLVKNKYTWDIAANKTYKVYQEVLKNCK